MPNLMRAPTPYFTALDSNGATIAGALIYTLAAGGAWPGDALATYSDAAGLVANSNPIVCDAAGRCVMHVLPTAYKLIICNASGTVLRTEDNIISPAPYNQEVDVAGIAGEALSALDVCFMGDGAPPYHAGKWYKADGTRSDESADPYVVGVAVADMVSQGSGTFRLLGRITGYVGLTAGAAYYVSETPGALSVTPGPSVRRVGVADTSTSIILDPQGTATEVLSVSTLFLSGGAGAISLAVPATGRVALDGGANTYIHEPSADNLGLVAGGVQQLRLTPTDVWVAGTLNISGTNKLAIDGMGSASDTYITESFANRLHCRAGGLGGVNLESAATAWSSASDERLKEIIEAITDGVSKVAQLRPVIARFKSDKPDKRRSMLIAQDVQRVLPEAVYEGDEGFLAMAYTDLIPLLVAAIQELSRRLAVLEEQGHAR